MAYLRPGPDAPASIETALVVVVPAADRLVGAHRDRLDEAAGWGVPAHVTVLYPFLPPAAVDDHVTGTVTALAASVPAFDCRFAATNWFDRDVLWLAPEPAQPFRRLTSLVWTAFPSCPPYGGLFDDPIPHLTVAERRLADLGTLRAVERAVQPGLPIHTHVDHLLLIAGAHAARSWHILHRFPLADHHS